MAQVKFTSSDVFARLAKGECANFRNGACVKGTPCTVITGESCDYFAKYVKPLLDFSEFNNKYSREAKVSVALNPKAKVVRRRRTATEPALSLDATAKREVAAKSAKSAAPAPVVAKAPAATVTPKSSPSSTKQVGKKPAKATAVTTTVGVDGAVRARPQPTAKTPPAAPPLPPHAHPRVTAREQIGAGQQQLLFDMPAMPVSQQKKR